MDDTFWRCHNAVVARGGRRQALRYYPRRKRNVGTWMIAIGSFVLSLSFLMRALGH